MKARILKPWQKKKIPYGTDYWRFTLVRDVFEYGLVFERTHLGKFRGEFNNAITVDTALCDSAEEARRKVDAIAREKGYYLL